MASPEVKPSMVIFLILEVSPLFIDILLLGILSSLLMNFISSLFALPFLGCADIFILKTPSANSTTEFLEEFGITFIFSSAVLFIIFILPIRLYIIS